MDSRVFFDGWASIARVAAVGVLAYISLIAILRVSGKRTLSKMNAFEFVVTVALGSTLATILLSRDVSLATGIAAVALLIGLQFAVAWLSVRLPVLRQIVKSEPRLLVRDGQLLHGAMKAERVSEDEVFAAIRSQGHASLAETEAVVIETDGSFSVLVKAPGKDAAALEAVEKLR